MSEHRPGSNQHEQFNQLPSQGERLVLPDAEHAEPLRPGEADPQKRQEQARSVIEEESARRESPLQDLQATERADSQTSQPGYVNQALQSITLHRELQHIRRKLPAPERLLSRVIHQPAIRIASDVAGKSVSRPSGLLGGGIVALAGTLVYSYMARHIGFEYNYAVFTLLFVGGFIVGVSLELLIWVFTRSRRKATE